MQVSPQLRECVQTYIDHEQWRLKAHALGAKQEDLERYEAIVGAIAARQPYAPNTTVWRCAWEVLIERLSWGLEVVPSDPRAWGLELAMRIWELRGWVTSIEAERLIAVAALQDIACMEWVKSKQEAAP
jgi:hypothetical protein